MLKKIRIKMPIENKNLSLISDISNKDNTRTKKPIKIELFDPLLMNPLYS